jgi:hypothetical protein
VNRRNGETGDASMNMTTNRREFLAATGALAASTLLARWGAAAEAGSEIKITRIVRFDLVSRRDKLAGKNSRLDVHGDTATIKPRFDLR